MSSPTLEDIAQNAGVSLKYLNNQISDEHVLEFAKYCAPYDEVGPYLGLSDDVIDAIGADKSKEELKRRETLKKWKEQYAMNATYRKFIKALLSCRKASRASEVCRVLQKAEGEPLLLTERVRYHLVWHY